MRTTRKGAANGRAKLTAEQVQQVRDLCRLPIASQRAVAAHMGLSQSTVSDILAGRLWGHLPDVPRARWLRPATPTELQAALSLGGRLAGPAGVHVLPPAISRAEDDQSAAATEDHATTGAEADA